MCPVGSQRVKQLNKHCATNIYFMRNQKYLNKCFRFIFQKYLRQKKNRSYPKHGLLLPLKRLIFFSFVKALRNMILMRNVCSIPPNETKRKLEQLQNRIPFKFYCLIPRNTLLLKYSTNIENFTRCALRSSLSYLCL